MPTVSWLYTCCTKRPGESSSYDRQTFRGNTTEDCDQQARAWGNSLVEHPGSKYESVVIRRVNPGDQKNQDGIIWTGRSKSDS